MLMSVARNTSEQWRRLQFLFWIDYKNTSQVKQNFEIIIRISY